MVDSGARRGIVLVVVLAVGAGVLWWLRTDAADPGPVQIGSAPGGAPVAWNGLRVAGDVLTVGYGGSPCQESTGSDVDERSDRVVVTVYADRAAGACTQVLQVHTLDVRLAQPLGQRPVYDGACLEQAAASGEEDVVCRRVPTRPSG